MKNVLPILVIPAVPHDGGIRFLDLEEQIDIGSELAEDLWKILSHCNGRNTIEDIAEYTEFEYDFVNQIINELMECKLILDSRDQYLHFHRVSSYPTNFNRTYSAEEVAEYTKSKHLSFKVGKEFTFKKDTDSSFVKTVNERKSCRSFSDKKLTLNQLGNICSVAYSINNGSVPSGGALYPLKIYAIVTKDQEDFEKGYYEYDSLNNKLIFFDTMVDEEKLKYCYNSDILPFNSSVQIVIATDIHRQPHKYANRGYRLTLIEVGHVAENICLYCTENGLGTCELGGILDNAMREELSLNEQICPILAIAVGYESEEELDNFNYLDFAEKNLIGTVVNDFSVQTFEGGSFFGVSATYGDKEDEQYAGATDTSYAKAVFKASMETYERYMSSQFFTDCFGSEKDLFTRRRLLSPRVLAPLTKEQAEKCGFVPYNEDLQINWTKGKSYIDGEEVLVSTDIVYYGFKKEKRIYAGHSSGIAAHFDYEKAIENGLAEIIERDAIMKSWYEHIVPNQISGQVLPNHVLKRKNYWLEQGRELFVFDMKSEYAPTIMVAIKSDTYPCFVCGASTTLDNDIEKAINKALNEVEYKLYLALKYPDETVLKPEEVMKPIEHGQFYHTLENSKRLDWLFSGETVQDLPKCKYSQEELHRMLDTVIVDMSDKEQEDIYVVRVISSHLYPISFGFHSSHYTYGALDRVHPDALELPHYFD